MKYYITPVKMTNNKSTNMLTRAWRGGAPYTVDGKVIGIATLKSSRNVESKISLSYDSATIARDVCTKEIKSHCHEHIHIPGLL